MIATLFIASLLSAPPGVTASGRPPAQQLQSKLQGLTPPEAGSLLATLQQAQTELRAGNSQTFELLAGSSASYPAAKVAPLKAFLDMSFEHPWSIERMPTAGLWQNYELRYFPPGPNSLMWKVSVTIDQTNHLVRVEMLYTAPPPF